MQEGEVNSPQVNRPDQGAKAEYAPFGTMDMSNLGGTPGSPAFFIPGEDYGTVRTQ